jgi:hypothetical protein
MTTPPDGEQPGAYPPPQHGWGQPPPGQWPYGPPGYPSYGPPPRQHPEANKALVLGIVGLAGGLACYLPILVSPVAWVIGHRVVREIDSMPFPQSGRGEARAGMILGIIGTCILGVGVLLLILLLGLASAGGF